MSGGEPEYASKPESVATVHLGVESNDDMCPSPDSDGSSTDAAGSLIDISTVTSITFQFSPANLVTRTENGGTFQTEYISYSMESNGVIHWTAYRVSASSSWWQEEYATSWACTETYPQTIEIQPPTAGPITTITIRTTTIITGRTTTLISEGSTTIILGEGGVISPTFVSALTTGGSAVYTTGQSSATTISTGSNGAITPSARSTPTPSALLSTRQGSSQVIISGGTYTIVSTGSQGVITPSPIPAPSSAPFVNASVSVSVGSVQFTTGGPTYTFFETGSGGVISPAVPSSFDGSNTYGSSVVN